MKILIILWVFYFIIKPIYLNQKGYVIAFFDIDLDYEDSKEIDYPHIVRKDYLELHKDKRIFLTEYCKINLISFFLFVHFSSLKKFFYNYYNEHYVEY